MKIGLQAWGSEGDISPFLALASGLVSAGHEVTLVVTDNIGRDYSQHALRGKFELINVPIPQPKKGINLEKIWKEIIEIGNPLQQAELVLKHGYDPVADAMMHAASELVRQSDVVIGHFFAYPLQIAAELANKPAASLAIVHNCVPTRTQQAPGLPDLGKWSYRIGWMLAQTIVNRIFLPRYNGQRERFGLPPLKDTMTQAWTSQRLNLLAVSPSICQRPSDWARHHVITGFINSTDIPQSTTLSPALLAFLDAGEPPIFLGFGSMMMPNAVDFARDTVEIWRNAITKLNIRAVVQLPEQLLHLVAENHSITAIAWADYRLLFPRCAAIVHHGGAGTTQSALRAGRPSLIVAHVSDQFFWGQELERLGVAGPTQRRKGLSVAKLSSAIKSTLLNLSLAPNAKILGENMLKENGVENAVRAIENYL